MPFLPPSGTLKVFRCGLRCEGAGKYLLFCATFRGELEQM